MNGIGILVGNLNAELLLDGHDNLDGIEAVETKIVGEVSGRLELFHGLGKLIRKACTGGYVRSGGR